MIDQARHAAHDGQGCSGIHDPAYPSCYGSMREPGTHFVERCDELGIHTDDMAAAQAAGYVENENAEWLTCPDGGEHCRVRSMEVELKMRGPIPPDGGWFYGLLANDGIFDARQESLLGGYHYLHLCGTRSAVAEAVQQATERGYEEATS